MIESGEGSANLSNRGRLREEDQLAAGKGATIAGFGGCETNVTSTK